MSKRETIRRLLVGDVRRVLRHRYGPVLPDDDAGRDDLMLLLRLAALSPKAAREKMQHEIELNAPWAAAAEAQQWIDDFQRLDSRHVWLGGKELGERINFKNAERERFKAWRIAPIDITADALAEQRKAKDRERKRRKRADAGAFSRQAYLANAKAKLKPWLAEGISRRTWYRRGTSPSATILNRKRNNLCHSSAKLNRPRASKRNLSFPQNKHGNGREAEPSLSPLPSSTMEQPVPKQTEEIDMQKKRAAHDRNYWTDDQA